MPELYIPKDSVPVSREIKVRRVFIQGKPKAGKTTSALTFPNPFVLDLDHNLPLSFEANSAPMWDSTWVEKYTKDNRLKPNLAGQPPNRRDVCKHWMRTNLSKFDPAQTFILDSWGFLQNGFDLQSDLPQEQSVTKSGEVDKYAFWKLKLAYSHEICEILKSAPCNVVVTCHETIERDKEGTPTGKLEPLMSGQFKDQLKGHFTDCFRQVAVDQKDSTGKPTGITDYLWQIKSDSLADCACSVVGLKDKFVKADYGSLFGLTPKA